jgi:hypothetical protein
MLRSVGYFEEVVPAARVYAYDNAMVECCGQEAQLNFLDAGLLARYTSLPGEVRE